MFPVPGDNIELTKPTIAAVNGVAFAGGWMIAQACDLCVASTRAQFAITEVKVGRSSPWAAPLIHMIPQRIMMEIILTGKPITAQRAYEIGLVNRLAEPEGLDDHRPCARHRDSRRRAAVGAGGARDGDALDGNGPFCGFARCKAGVGKCLSKRGCAGRSQGVRREAAPAVEGPVERQTPGQFLGEA